MRKIYDIIKIDKRTFILKCTKKITQEKKGIFAVFFNLYN
jgi:hypothetical protein